MINASRRLLVFAVAFFSGLGFLAVLLWQFSQPPRTIEPSPIPLTPTPRTVATINGEPIYLGEWERSVALDRVMNTLVGQMPPSPEDTLNRLINEHLVLQAAVAAAIPEPDRTQVDSWLPNFLVSWNLDEADLDQALTRAGLSRAELLEEIVPRLLRVQRALQELPPGGDGEAWVADLQRQAEVEVLGNLTAPLMADQVTPTPRTTSQTTSQPPTLPTLPTGPRVGEMAPNFTLPTANGTTVTLADLRGRPVLLNFWATWCGPCREELPTLQDAYQTNTEDLVVLGIDVRESPEKVFAFVADLGLELPLLLDQDGQVSDAYQVRGLPTSLFIDRDGSIVARHVGPLDQATLNSYLAALLVAIPTPSHTP